MCFHQALALRPDYPEACNNLGTTLADSGKSDEAIAYFQQALALRPGYPEAHYNLGNAFLKKKHWEEAVSCYKQTLALRPDNTRAYINFGVALAGQGLLDDAVTAYECALALSPDDIEAHNNLGNALTAQGLLDGALLHYRHAMTSAPNEPFFHSNLIFALHMAPGSNLAALLAEHQAWERQYGEPRRRFHKPHPNNPDPDRRLRIGYVSPDLHEHPVGRFLLPLLQHHDHDNFEIICYANVARPDALTQRLRSCADRWQNFDRANEQRQAEQIWADEIDILIDLALHTRGSQLAVFARRPAPVQVTYLAYAGTSGLSAMDYRLTDPYLDPPGTSNEYYSETSVRLPDTYWCYQAPEDAPEVRPPPALSAGHVTFGCLNNFAKVNEHVLTLWARLLRAVPNSRLLLHAREGSHRERVREFLTQGRRWARRIDFAPLLPSREYFAQYEQMTSPLDTFPYAGGTTTVTPCGWACRSSVWRTNSGGTRGPEHPLQCGAARTRGAHGGRVRQDCCRVSQGPAPSGRTEADNARADAGLAP